MARLSKAKVKRALIENHGNVSASARSLGCDRSSIYTYIKKYDEIARVLEDGRESLVDRAEEALKLKIDEGDTAAIIYTLKSRGKHRGWSERHEVEHSGQVEVYTVQAPKILNADD